MTHTISKKAGPGILIIALLAVGLLLYAGSRVLQPARLGVMIEKQLNQRLGLAVSIRSAEFNPQKGLHLTLSGLTIGKPTDNLYVQADKIGTDLSFWKLFLGEVFILRIDLDKPDIRILSITDFSFGKNAENGFSLPIITVREGRIRTAYKKLDVDIDAINGRFSHDFLNIRSRAFGAPIRVFARKIKSYWIGQVQMDHISLSEVSPDVKGLLGVQVDFKQRRDRTKITMAITSPKIQLPGGGRPFQNLSLTSSCLVSDRRIAFTDLKLKAADFFFSGTAHFEVPRRMDAYGATPFQLNLDSRAFAYEDMVAHLPADELPDWAGPLFYQQIRGGTIRIHPLVFQGILADLIDADQFFRNLSIAADLSDFSYGTGYGPERVTGISGQFSIENGDMLIRHLSGATDHALLQCMDLIFPDLMAPDLRSVVYVDLDMPAPEFRYLWRAGMEPRAAYDLLLPLTAVSGGRIQADVTVQDNVIPHTTQAQGEVRLENCSFTWNADQVAGLAGSITAEGPDSTIRIDAAGRFNQLPVDRFRMTLQNVFTTPAYRYQIQTHRLPDIPDFQTLPKTTLQLYGTGRDLDYQGSAVIKTSGFKLMGHDFRPATGSITGTGRYKGSLGDRQYLHFYDVMLATKSGQARLEFKHAETRSRLTLAGILDLLPAKPEQLHACERFRGSLDLGLVWTAGRTATGHIQLKRFVVQRNGQDFIFNGRVQRSGDQLSTDSLLVSSTDMSTRITGSLSLKKAAPHFTGELAMDGFSIDDQAAALPEALLPPEFSANMFITATHALIYGIPFEKGETRLQIENRRLRLSDIILTGASGRVTGNVVLPDQGQPILDIDLDLRDTGLKKLFQRFEPDKTVIDGTMQLTGNLQGPKDALNGFMLFNAKDGYTDQSPLLSNIFAALNLYKIVKSRNVDIRKKNFTFNWIASTLNIKDGLITFDDFLLDSDSIQFSAVGQYRINEKQIDALIGVQPFEAIDKTISAIPIIGWVLTGEGDELFVICLKAEGDIDNPRISLAPTDTVSKPIAGTLMRILKLPGKVFIQSRDLIRSQTEKE